VAKSSAKKSETKITRITASDTEAPKKETKEAPVASVEVSDTKKAKRTKKADTPAAGDKPAKKRRGNVFVRIGRYFKGAWTELRLVRWPDRKATWGMTGALIAFTLFFVVVILVLDYGFSQLFKLILGTN
jgi:preprotein translocase subunit SecE